MKLVNAANMPLETIMLVEANNPQLDALDRRSFSSVDELAEAVSAIAGGFGPPTSEFAPGAVFEQDIFSVYIIGSSESGYSLARRFKDGQYISVGRIVAPSNP